METNILKTFLDIALKKKAGHLGSSLSAMPIMNALYKRYNFKDDIFVLSKGHAALGFYTILREYDYISQEELDSVYQNNSRFYGHVSRNPEKGIQVTAGSLGHAASVAVGLAMANRNKKVFCLLGDGECDEGSVWEAFAFAARHKIKNIFFVIDYNGYQGYDKLIEKELPRKVDSFGLHVESCLNYQKFEEKLDGRRIVEFKPTCYLVYSDKTGGFSCLEGLSSHYRKMDEDLYLQILKELEGGNSI